MYNPSTVGATIHERRSSPVPVGVITSGVVAGALFIAAAIVGWLLWGKSIKRMQSVKWKETEANCKTRANTLYNSTSSELHVHSYLSPFPRPTEKKKKFTSQGNIKMNNWDLDIQPGFSTFLERDSSAATSVPKISKPKPLRSAGALPNIRVLRVGSINSTLERVEPAIPHKPSTISSSSMYSTASGEEHQVRVPANLILAALGNFGSVDAFRSSCADRNQQSMSFGKGSFPRLVLGHQGYTNSNRYSQAGSRSIITATSRDSYGAPVGLAL